MKDISCHTSRFMCNACAIATTNHFVKCSTHNIPILRELPHTRPSQQKQYDTGHQLRYDYHRYGKAILMLILSRSIVGCCKSPVFFATSSKTKFLNSSTDTDPFLSESAFPEIASIMDRVKYPFRIASCS